MPLIRRGRSPRAAPYSRSASAWRFNVADIVRLGASEEHGARIESIVDAALAEVELIDLADRVITTLSGGEQQRGHFARVLVQLACAEASGDSGVLLLDEPTAALDLRHQLGMLNSIKRRAAGGTLVIAILHDLNLAALLAGRIIVLDGGRVDCDGTPTETITGEMLRRVFDIETSVSNIPASGVPFVLPQAMTAAKWFNIS